MTEQQHQIENGTFAIRFRGDGDFVSIDDEFPSAIRNHRSDGTVRFVTNENPSTAFIFVESGNVTLLDSYGEVWLSEGMYAAIPGPYKIAIPANDAHVLVVERKNWLGMRTIGGPIEPLGRLKYIDTCSDSLLIAPPVKGDACLNLLHFPPGIEQTFHTHPSIRGGVVAKGRGWCETPEGLIPLEKGSLWLIKTGGVHRFITRENEEMDVIAFHPDSDFGPEHETHPMINRTLVGGAKMNNTIGIHQEAKVIDGYDLSRGLV